MNDVDRIISKVWGNSPVSYEPLNGGFSNFTYKVRVNDSFFVLRINGSQNDYLGLSRQDELNVIRLAGEMGIAPKVMPQSTAEYLITEFVNAPVLAREDILQPPMVQSAMGVLKNYTDSKAATEDFPHLTLLANT